MSVNFPSLGDARFAANRLLYFTQQLIVSSLSPTSGGVAGVLRLTVAHLELLCLHSASDFLPRRHLADGERLRPRTHCHGNGRRQGLRGRPSRRHRADVQNPSSKFSHPMGVSRLEEPVGFCGLCLMSAAGEAGLTDPMRLQNSFRSNLTENLTVSQHHTVRHGVPQGRLFGPSKVRPAALL